MIRYSSKEHRAAGNIAFKQHFAEHKDLGKLLGQYYDKRKGLKISDDFWLKPGDFVALFGDFIFLNKKSISDGATPRERRRLFKEAFKKFIGEDPAYVSELSKAIKSDSKGTVSDTIKFSKITHRHLFSVPEYLKLLIWNFDHFGEDAILAYEAGHAVAIKTSQRASKIQDPDKRAAKFAKAYMQELAACHFCSDGRAAGHIDTPRREIDAYVAGRKFSLFNKVKYVRRIESGLLASAMHGEDNANGLNVTNEREDKGVLYGDNHYARGDFTHESVERALVSSLSDIHAAFSGTEEVKNEFRELWPKVDTDSETREPMFEAVDGKVVARGRGDNWNPDAMLVAMGIKAIASLIESKLLFTLPAKPRAKSEVGVSERSALAR